LVLGRGVISGSGSMGIRQISLRKGGTGQDDAAPFKDDAVKIGETSG
jgi:hypothetical protein